MRIKHTAIGKLNPGLRTDRLDAFTRAYIECALWFLSTDDNDTPMDDNYDVRDMASPESLRIMVEDCKAFQTDNAELLEQAFTVYNTDDKAAYAGHDFWLTRNHHGAGFWDRGLGEVGRKLTDKAHEYGSCDLVVGDDGKVYAQ